MKKLPVLLLLLSGVFLGCEPTPDDARLFDEFVVSTNYNSDADFSAYTTYTISSDTIGLVSNLASDDTIIVGTSYARPVVEAVKSNLDGRGYERVDKTKDPDLAVNVFVLKNLDIFQQVSYYPPGYYGGYYGYYGYYSNYYVDYYVQNTGTLVVEIVDLKNVTQGQVQAVWNAYLGDVFSAFDLVGQSTDAIDQAFTQSPYMVKQQ